MDAGRIHPLYPRRQPIGAASSDKEVAINNVVEIEIKYYEKVGLLFIIHDIFPDNCNHTRI